MSQDLFILVEWVDERNVFPSYGVVHANSLVSEDDDVHPGKMTFVRSKHGNTARRAQILRVADDKRLLKEHKIMLERQDHQVKNMLTMCMQTIKEMKTDPLLYGSMNASTSQSVKHESNGTRMGAGSRMAKHDDSDSASDDEIINDTKNLKISQLPQKTPAQSKMLKDRLNSVQNDTAATNTPNTNQLNKKRPIMSSTPIITEQRKLNEIPKLTFDQGTQTDETLEVPPEKINKIEEIVGKLHQQFLNLISGLQIDYHDESAIPYQNDEGQNNTSNFQEAIPAHVQVPNTSVNTSQLNDSNAEVQAPQLNAKALQIRRVSAHTTNNVEQCFANDRNTSDSRNEMVSIGTSGKAMVPERLLNDIDWTSYTGATRQLLQALFPRKVLATSSLTGKKSPAFTNIPAKQCLDPQIVHDIVEYVSRRCNVPRRTVRTCITIKCTDEAKLYRSRLQKKQMNLLAKRENQENFPPSPALNQDPELE